MFTIIIMIILILVRPLEYYDIHPSLTGRLYIYCLCINVRWSSTDYKSGTIRNRQGSNNWLYRDHLANVWSCLVLESIFLDMMDIYGYDGYVWWSFMSHLGPILGRFQDTPFSRARRRSMLHLTRKSQEVRHTGAVRCLHGGFHDQCNGLAGQNWEWYPCVPRM